MSKARGACPGDTSSPGTPSWCWVGAEAEHHEDTAPPLQPLPPGTWQTRRKPAWGRARRTHDNYPLREGGSRNTSLT